MFAPKSILALVFALASTAFSAHVQVVGYSDGACTAETGSIQLTLNECQALPAIASSYKVNTNSDGIDNGCTSGSLVVAGWQASSDCSDGDADINIGPIANDAGDQEGSCGIARIQSVKLYCQ